jgi:Fatty acid desaturase
MTPGTTRFSGTRQRNRMLGRAVGNTLIGLSFGWWVPKHNAHHAHPNEVGRDPDIGEGAALAWPGVPGNGPGPVASWLARWQAPLFFPLMLLRSGGMHVLGIRRLRRRRDRASAIEAALLMLHAALYLSGTSARRPISATAKKTSLSHSARSSTTSATPEQPPAAVPAVQYRQMQSAGQRVSDLEHACRVGPTGQNIRFLRAL